MKNVRELLGIPSVMECNTGVLGQQGDVEFAVGDLAEAVPGAADVRPGLEQREEPLHRIRHPTKRIALRQSQELLETISLPIFSPPWFRFFILNILFPL